MNHQESMDLIHDQSACSRHLVKTHLRIKNVRVERIRSLRDNLAIRSVGGQGATLSAAKFLAAWLVNQNKGVYTR